MTHWVKGAVTSVEQSLAMLAGGRREFEDDVLADDVVAGGVLAGGVVADDVPADDVPADDVGEVEAVASGVVAVVVPCPVG